MWYSQYRFHVHRYLSRATSTPFSISKLHSPRFSSSLPPMGAIGTATVDTSERLARLRALMQQQNVNVGAVVIPSEDERACDSFLQCTRADQVIFIQISASTPPKLTNGERSFPDSMALQVTFDGWETDMRIRAHVLIRRMCCRYPQGCLSLHRWSVLPTSRTAVGQVRNENITTGCFLSPMSQKLDFDEARVTR